MIPPKAYFATVYARANHAPQESELYTFDLALPVADIGVHGDWPRLVSGEPSATRAALGTRAVYPACAGGRLLGVAGLSPRVRGNHGQILSSGIGREYEVTAMSLRAIQVAVDIIARRLGHARR